MIDEDLLHERLTAAAAAQDGLLLRALTDDLTDGRRRLRRHRVLAGSGVTAAVAAVAVVAVGLNGWLTTNASPPPDKGPVAGHTSTTPDTSIPVGQQPLVPAQDAAFSQRLTAALYAHLDPGKKHLDFSSGGFTIDRQGGTINSGGNRIGWRMPGQKGAEGFVGLSVQPKTRVQRPCGSTSEPRLTCHSVTLPNGRTAQFGRQGDAAVLHYQQPDGEWINVTVSTSFGNNSEKAVHNLGITDQMLFALVQDDRLTLPTKAEDAQAKRDKPTKEEVRAALEKAFPGGTFTEAFPWMDIPESQHYALNWRKGNVTATISFALQKHARFDCPTELGVAKCQQLPAPGGRHVLYGEKGTPGGLPAQPIGKTAAGKPIYQDGNPKTTATYSIGGTYSQPGNDGISLQISYPSAKPPADRITKEQVVSFLTDPTLDK